MNILRESRIVGGFFAEQIENPANGTIERFATLSPLMSREVKMKRIALALLLLRSICVLSQVIPEKPNPKVRAITAFVRLDRTNVLKQIEDTVVVLRRAESEFKSIGYDVETIRITTQPLAELVSGLSE